MEASPVIELARLKAVDPKSRRSKAGGHGSGRGKPKLGLRAWMERVLKECERARAGFDVEAVHDLRVSLRRCRSLADGLMALDPEGEWKAMKKAGKKVFQALGDLRDMQVMEEWLEKLGDTGDLSQGDSSERSDDRDGEQYSGEGQSREEHSANGGASQNHASEADDDPVRADPVIQKLLDHLHAREAECKQLAVKDLDSFDRKQWRRWARELPARGARVRPGSLVYLHLALEKWTAAYDLHKHALRTRSRVGLHQLRIGIKRFRYTVENFLPRLHAAWGADLKELQDLLGEVHDLDVLWATALEIGAFPDLASKRRWQARLNRERGKRIAKYRAKMVGRDSLWRVWRAQLPEGAQLRAAAMSRMRVWAGYLDPEFAHSEHVTRLALGLYDGLRAAGLLPAHGVLTHLVVGVDQKSGPHRKSDAGGDAEQEVDARAVLQAASLMHDVGKAHGAAKHWKASYRMIREMALPLGWSARELEMAAVVARYHRGALPSPRGKTMQILELPDRHTAMELAGILRLANALDGVVPRDSVERGRAARGSGDSSPHGRLTAHSRFSSQASEHELEVQVQSDFVVVRVAGHSAAERSAEIVAGARHLLETVLRRPVLVRGLRSATARGRSLPERRAARN